MSMFRERIQHESLAFELDDRMATVVAIILDKSLGEVRDFVQAVNDAILSDKPGTLRVSPSGKIAAVRKASLDEPYEVFYIGGEMSHSMYSRWTAYPTLLTWKVVHDPDTEVELS